MTGKELLLIQARVREELSNINQLLSELEERRFICTEGTDDLKVISNDGFVLRAIGSVLHDFYVAVENIFEMIAREIDETIPQGTAWHIQLLKQMALEVPRVRSAVISRDTMLKLDKYRAFRHVFRNVYGFNLDADRLKELLRNIQGTTGQFKREIEAFTDSLEQYIE